MARCFLILGQATLDARIIATVASGMLNLRAVMTSSQFGTNSREEKLVFEFLLTGVSKMLIFNFFYIFFILVRRMKLIFEIIRRNISIFYLLLCVPKLLTK